METNNNISLAHEYELRPLTFLAGGVLLILAIIAILSLRDDKRDNSIPTGQASESFPSIALQATAAYVYDIRTGKVLFAHNEDKRLPLASLAKLMSALVAQEIGFKHNTVTITEAALDSDGDTGLLRDEKWSLEALLNFSLISSSNDGIRAAALTLGALSRADVSSEEIISDFVGAMNQKAGEMGLKNTYFWNETGLDLPAQAGESNVKGGAYGSARDITALMTHILNNYPEIFSMTREPVVNFTSLDNKVHIAKNTNDIIYDIPGLLASKTGYTANAGGSLSIIFDPELGHPIAITVLGSTENGRFNDVRTLVNATLQFIENSKLKIEN